VALPARRMPELDSNRLRAVTSRSVSSEPSAPDPIKQAPAVRIEVADPISLQPIIRNSRWQGR
jgi:hypothetical protein